MQYLVVCARCRHGVTVHASDGCSHRDCRCELHPEAVVDEELEYCRRQHAALWRPLASPAER